MRMWRKTMTFGGMVAIILFTTSCATLIRGTKQSVTFTTNVPGAVIKVDQNIEVKSGESVRLKTRKDHMAEANVPGYELARVQIKKRLHPLIFINAISLPVALIPGILLLANDNFEDDVFGFYLLIYSFSFPETMGGIDAAAGGGMQLPKEVHFDLHKLPEPFTGTNLPLMRVTSVSVANRGETIGKVHERWGRQDTRMVLMPGGRNSLKHQMVYVVDDQVKDEVNERMRTYGCNMLIESGEALGGGNERYQISLDLQSIEANAHYVKGQPTTEASVNSHWVVRDARNGSIVLERTLATTGNSATAGGPIAINQAITYSIDALLDDPGFRKLME